MNILLIEKVVFIDDFFLVEDEGGIFVVNF